MLRRAARRFFAANVGPGPRITSRSRPAEGVLPSGSGPAERLGAARSRPPARPWQTPLFWGIVAFGLTAPFTVADTAARGRALSLLALLVVPLSMLAWRRPATAALLIVAGGVIFRLGYVGIGVGDELTVTQAAAQVAFDGGNPYGRGYSESSPPGAPYPYGPLALLWSLPGAWIELAASAATMLLVARARAWVTLGLMAGMALFAAFTVYGGNNASPGFFITAGLLALRERPLLGGVLLAIAAALKPYAFAWFPAAIGYGGLPALLGSGLATAVLWSPLLAWGPLSFLRSVEMAENLPHHLPNAANVPVLRFLAVPIALASLFARRWEWAVLSGAVIFLTVLFLGRWASTAYVLAVLPILGIVLETQVLSRLLAARRRVTAMKPHTLSDRRAEAGVGTVRASDSSG